MKFMTKLENIIMNRTTCSRETANLIANDILDEVDKADWVFQNHAKAIAYEEFAERVKGCILERDDEIIDTIKENLLRKLK